jgi:hypothetical protein
MANRIPSLRALEAIVAEASLQSLRAKSVLLAVLVNAFCACSPHEDCTPGKWRCDQGGLFECVAGRDKLSGDYTTWSTVGVCGDPSLCIASSDTDAFCVASAAKPAACADHDGSVCDGDHLLYCKEGWAQYDYDCAASNARCSSASTAACVDARTGVDASVLCSSSNLHHLLCSGDEAVLCSPAVGAPPESRSCPQCRMYPLPGSIGTPSMIAAGEPLYNFAACGRSLGEPCSDSSPETACNSSALEGTPDNEPLRCVGGICTLACQQPASAGAPDSCQAALTDPAKQVLLSPTTKIGSASCGPDGFCVFGD